MMTATRKSIKATRPFSCEFVAITLRINDTKYACDELRTDTPGSRTWRLSKHSGDHEVYDIAQDASGLTTCSCPSYATTHAGTSSMCKHSRALVALGLLPHPAVHEVIAPAAEPCCDKESAPCQGCLDINPAVARHEEDRTDYPTPTEDGPSAAPALPTEADAPDALPYEADPTLPDAPWDPWDDDTHRNLGPEPTRAEAAEVFGEMAAAAHLDHSERLTLEQLVSRQVEFYRGLGNPAGEMLADHMAEMLFKIRLTSSTTPEEYRERSQQLEESAREAWHDAGLASCACQAEPEPELTSAGRWA